MADVPERLGVLENRMNRVEEGVANFRDFQSDARDFFSTSIARDVEREKQLNKRDQEIKESAEARDRRINIILGILGFILALMVALEGSRQLHGNFTSVTPPTALSSNQKAPQEAGTRGMP